MRFKIGIAVGFAAGYWVGSTPPDQRRAKLESLWTGVRDNPRVQHVTDAVVTDARRLGDAIEHRLVDTAEGTTDAVAGTVEPDEGSANTEQATAGARSGRRSA
jgi:hypothetical protein